MADPPPVPGPPDRAQPPALPQAQLAREGPYGPPRNPLQDGHILGHRNQELRIEDFVYYKFTRTRMSANSQTLITTTTSEPAIIQKFDRAAHMVYIKYADAPGHEWVRPHLLTIRTALTREEGTEDPWK